MEEKKLTGLNAEEGYTAATLHNQKLVWQLGRWMEFGQHIINTAFHRNAFDIDEWAAWATDLIEETEDNE